MLQQDKQALGAAQRQLSATVQQLQARVKELVGQLSGKEQQLAVSKSRSVHNLVNICVRQDPEKRLQRLKCFFVRTHEKHFGVWTQRLKFGGYFADA